VVLVKLFCALPVSLENMFLSARSFLAAFLCSVTHAKIVVITGATGQTGSAVYSSLKSKGVTVRALVRSVEKAKKVLGCKACDASEGVFVGDITKPDSLAAAMSGSDTLVITTGPAVHCTIPQLYIGCHFYKGAEPKTIAWEGVKNQVSAFANSSGPAIADRHVILVSNTLTTRPNNFLDKIDNAHSTFYALNGEVFTMASGVPFTIVKPNGLGSGDAGKKEIIVGHDDQAWNAMNPNTEFISRLDVARLLTYAALNPEQAKGMRFDVTSKAWGGSPTTDVAKVFAAAKYPWNSHKATNVIV
jgi:hypothetical protein